MMWYIYLVLAVLFPAQNCISNNETYCADHEFLCDNGYQCYFKESICNGKNDCNDGSDEDYCGNNYYSNCRQTHFKCYSGQCIPAVGKCDGYLSCRDGSDEKDCGDHLKNAVEMAKRWILSEMREDYSWGKDTPRAVVALFLAEPTFFETGTDEKSLLISKQLQLQLALDLARNSSWTMSLPTLSLYINALLATCNDPSNFYGLNLVDDLRQRTDIKQASGDFISPSVYQTLCFTGKSTHLDFIETEEIFTNAERNKGRADLKSLAALALSCMTADNRNSNRSELTEEHFKEYFSNMDRKKFGNIYADALTIQAKIACIRNYKAFVDLSYFSRIYQKYNGSFGDILSTYYILPAIAERALETLQNSCHRKITNGLPALEVLKKEEKAIISVEYSLYLGNKSERKHAVQMKIPENANFLDLMRMAADENPVFKFKYESLSTGYPVVYSIANTPNDAERGTFWHLYTSSTNRSVKDGDFRPYSGDIRQLKLKSDDLIVFWFKGQD